MQFGFKKWVPSVCLKYYLDTWWEVVHAQLASNMQEEFTSKTIPFLHAGQELANTIDRHGQAAKMIILHGSELEGPMTNVGLAVLMSGFHFIGDPIFYGGEFSGAKPVAASS